MFEHELINCSQVGFMGRLSCLNFGGGKSSVPKPPKAQPIKFPKMPKVHMPEMPALPPAAQAAAATPIPPPPTANRVEIDQAEQQARLNNLKKKGLRKTVLAGETGGSGAKLGGGTVLGGYNAPR